MACFRDDTVARLIKAGELEVLNGDYDETGSYSMWSNFTFIGQMAKRRTIFG